jgi:hypothetical protein
LQCERPVQNASWAGLMLRENASVAEREVASKYSPAAQVNITFILGSAR